MSSLNLGRSTRVVWGTLASFLLLAGGVYGSRLLTHSSNIEPPTVQDEPAPATQQGESTPAIDPAQAAKDVRVVETLLRVRTIDPNSKPELKAAVLRYLQSVAGTERQLEVAEALNIVEAAPSLIDVAVAHSEEPLGIAAARVVFRLGAQQEIFKRFRQSDEATQLSIIRALGGVGNQATSKRLTEMLSDLEASRPIRQQAVQGLLATRRGQDALAEMVEADQFPQDLKVFTAGEIQRNGPPELRGRLANHLDLPATVDAQPLPSLDELMLRTGDVELGRTLFFAKGTCGNCHVVGQEGKEVGPNLSEIGAKLSRDAMFVSILDPSAAISHNFETFVAETLDGEILQGLLISHTDDEVTLKLADGQVRVIATADVDLLEKQPVSLMPAGLQQNLTADELVSLVEYLLTLKPAQ